MIVQTEDMARDVRVAIDMNREDAPLILDGDRETLSIDDIIKAKLADGIRMVEIEAPRHMLESGHDFGERMFIGADGKGFVILPEDFMRLISFRMSDWRRTVYEAISDDDPAYGLQSSRWKGVCGTPDKPVCAIVRRNEGKVLEFYSSRDDKAVIVQATYLPRPRIDAGGGIDVAEECYRAAVYRAASLTLASLGDSLATTMLEISKSLINQ